MAKDVGDLIGTAIGRVARETVQTVASNNKRKGGPNLSGGKGLAAGAGLATLVPLAFKGASSAKNALSGSGGDSSSGSGPIDKAKSKLEGNVKDKAKEGAKDALPFGGGGSKGEEGVGKGRRMPIQQSMDIPLDVASVYEQWTEYEEWPSFMHRLQSVSQEDDETVKFKAKIWGKSKEFTAEIVEERPNDYIKWKVSEGLTHTGAVAFREVAPGLTRVEVNMDVQPGSLLEKAARGMRHIKRAVRADLHRFKAHVMMDEEATGEWRDSGGESAGASGSESRASSSRSSSRSPSSGNGRSSGSSSSRGSSSGSRSSGSSSRGSSSGSRSSGSSSRGSSSGGRSPGPGSRGAGPGGRGSGSGSRSSGSSSRGSSSGSRSSGSSSRGSSSGGRSSGSSSRSSGSSSRSSGSSSR